MKKNYILDRNGIKLKYKIDGNKFILYFDFFIYKYPIYKKDIYLQLNFGINYILKTSLTYIGNPKHSTYFKYKKSFKVSGARKILVLNLENYGIDLYNLSYIDFDLFLKITIDDSIFFDTKIHKETDIKKVGNSYIID